MNAELAQYVHPKRKAVEVASDQGAPLVPHRVVVQIVPTPEVPPERADGHPRHRDISPEELAKVLSILTGGEFTPDCPASTIFPGSLIVAEHLMSF